MPNDCGIYVDPEEDEIFFGCTSDREKNACTKLLKQAGSSLKGECNVNKVLDECMNRNVDIEYLEQRMNSEQSNNISAGVFISDLKNSVLTLSELEENGETNKILFSSMSPRSEFSFSTPMKYKIDKRILTTPKNIVKAEKDRGFLKVLSEIALVKGETEAYNKPEVRKDEDKENRIISSIPEIKITEATPEKGDILSSSKSINAELRRFKIIHNSPRNENSVDYKSKPFAENGLESEKNFKNKYLDQDFVQVLNSDDNNKSIDIIDFNGFESGKLNVNITLEKEENESQPQNVDFQNDEKEISGKQQRVCEIITLSQSAKPIISEKLETVLKSSVKVHYRPLVSAPKDINPPDNFRFSKEARKVVEFLKKVSVDDTSNFTIPEIDVENENSFLSPELLSVIDETVIFNKNVEVLLEKTSPTVPMNPADNKLDMKSKTVEKDQRKLQSIKCLSQRKIYNKNENDAEKKCSKKLRIKEKRPASAETVRGNRMGESNAVSCSRIPVFGLKNSKMAISERVAQPLMTKTPSDKLYKNSKFNHIESPINAYIHGKPTSLVVNVKPEVKKQSLTKVLKAQAIKGVPKALEKITNQQKSNNNVKLPFVEYKSATPYKIEKRPESRLPRLAPNVMKLIGLYSPKVLKHEGRFYLNTPRKQSSMEATIVADPKEVSVVLSQPVQKSNAVK